MASAANELFWYPKDYLAESERRRERMTNFGPAFPTLHAVRYFPSNEALRDIAQAQARRRSKEKATKTPTTPNATMPRTTSTATTNFASLKADKIDEFLAQAALKNRQSLAAIRAQAGVNSLSDTERRPRRIVLEQDGISITVQDVRPTPPVRKPVPPVPPAPAPTPAPEPAPTAAPIPIIIPASPETHSRRSSGSSIMKPRLESVPENPPETTREQKRSSVENRSVPAPAAAAAPVPPVRSTAVPIPVRQQASSQAPIYFRPNQASISPPSSAGSASSNISLHSRHSEPTARSFPIAPPAPASGSSTNSRHSDASQRDRDREPSVVKSAAQASKPVRPRTLSESAARAPPNTPVKSAPPAGILKHRDYAYFPAPANVSPSERRRHELPSQNVASAPAPAVSGPRNAFGEMTQPTPVSPPAPAPASVPAPQARPAPPPIPLNPAMAFAALGPEGAARMVRKTRFAGIPEEELATLRPPQPTAESIRRASLESGTDAAEREHFHHTHRRGASATNADGAPPPGLPTIRRQPGAGPPTRPVQRAPQHAVAAALRHRQKKTLSVASLEVWTGETTEGDTSGMESARSSVYQTWGTLPPSVDVQDVISRWIEMDAAKAREKNGRRNRPGVTFDFPEDDLPSSTRLTESRVGRLPDAVRNHNER